MFINQNFSYQLDLQILGNSTISIKIASYSLMFQSLVAFLKKCSFKNWWHQKSIIFIIRGLTCLWLQLFPKIQFLCKDIHFQNKNIDDLDFCVLLHLQIHIFYYHLSQNIPYKNEQIFSKGLAYAEVFNNHTGWNKHTWYYIGL